MDPAVDTFFQTVVRSGLLDSEQLDTSYRAVPARQRRDPHAVAEHLIKTGKLSRFQATKLLAGTARGLLLGPFQILAPLGRGGMASVYLARDSRSGQLLALKVLLPKKSPRQERLLARFRREMDLSRRVADPNIARTFDVGEKLGVYYIAMEFIPGKDLNKLVEKQGPFPVPRAARLFAEVALGLQHAHEQGLIHRDVKPSNIRVTPADHAKLLDLGLALIEGDEPAEREVSGGPGYIVGSMDYIAPEQTRDAYAVDARADIYALGCSLYFTLTGQPPFPGGTRLEKVLCHRNEEPVPLSKRNPRVPARFVNLIQRMMAKAPDDRPTSAQAVYRELLTWAPPATAPSSPQAEETSFRQAVASLQAADLDDDLEAIPVAEPVVIAPRQVLLWVAGGAAAVLLMMALAVGAILLMR
jgi:serine/threonine protein kinase